MGLIVPLGEWVLREACNEAARWPDPVKVAVNLSPVQFRNRGLVTTVAQALAAARLAPNRLELEITEAVLLQDDETIVTMLHQLRALGVRISMDDFGTGYSSLSYLRSFPFDKIKIDRSFIKDIDRNRDSAIIIKAIASLGQSLGIETTAEGVETEEQLDIVRRAGCTEMQGYLVSPPRPACDLPDLIARFRREERRRTYPGGGGGGKDPTPPGKGRRKEKKKTGNGRIGEQPRPDAAPNGKGGTTQGGEKGREKKKQGGTGKPDWHGAAPVLCYKRTIHSSQGHRNDRPLLLDHAERPQDHDFSRRDRASVQDFPDQHRQRGAIRQGLPEESRRTTASRR